MITCIDGIAMTGEFGF